MPVKAYCNVLKRPDDDTGAKNEAPNAVFTAKEGPIVTSQNDLIHPDDDLIYWVVCRL